MVGMKVEPIGSYLPTDAEGFIVNPTSLEKVQPKWLPVIERVKDAYREHFGECLHSVYIRGSVAKGGAIDNVSDLDSFAVVALPHDQIDLTWSQDFDKQVMSEYSFVRGVEIAVIPLDELDSHRADKIMIKTQSICVYGLNLADDIPPLKPGKETAQHVKGIAREVAKTREWLDEEHAEDEIRRRCAWIMKRLLRAGFELVMERSGKYTRDLYPCYEGFSEYYPEKRDEMYRVLELAINPTSDTGEIRQTLGGLGTWIGFETERVFEFT